MINKKENIFNFLEYEFKKDHPTYYFVQNEYLEKIHDYLIEAIQKHPEFPDNVVEMVAIMAEEAGEAIRAANNYQHENGSIEELKEELFQTAAMCLRCLHHLP